MQLKEFLSMGNYGVYVWSAYLVAFIILSMNMVLSMRAHKKSLYQLKKKLNSEKTFKQNNHHESNSKT